MIGKVLRDAVALERSIRATISATRAASSRPERPGGATTLEERASTCLRLLGNDAFAVLVLWRAREVATRFRIPLANTFLRRIQCSLFGLEIDRRARIGEGVWFVHPVGTVVGGDSRLGSRVRLMGANTIGTNLDDGFPVIGDDVVVGVGARILGPVRVGEGARIGAGAIVLRDVPAGSVAVGVPARIISSSKRSLELDHGKYEEPLA